MIKVIECLVKHGVGTELDKKLLLFKVKNKSGPKGILTLVVQTGSTKFLIPGATCCMCDSNVSEMISGKL